MSEAQLARRHLAGIGHQHVNFSALAESVDYAAPRPSLERGGRPAFPTELMVRVLLIQQLLNPRDEQMEFQLPDRLSSQRFVGLGTSTTASRSGPQGTPDQGWRQRGRV